MGFLVLPKHGLNKIWIYDKFGLILETKTVEEEEKRKREKKRRGRKKKKRKSKQSQAPKRYGTNLDYGFYEI